MKQATLEAHFILETYSDEYYSCYAVKSFIYSSFNRDALLTLCCYAHWIFWLLCSG